MGVSIILLYTKKQRRYGQRPPVNPNMRDLLDMCMTCDNHPPLQAELDVEAVAKVVLLTGQRKQLGRSAVALPPSENCPIPHGPHKLSP